MDFFIKNKKIKKSAVVYRVLFSNNFPYLCILLIQNNLENLIKITASCRSPAYPRN